MYALSIERQEPLKGIKQLHLGQPSIPIFIEISERISSLLNSDLLFLPHLHIDIIEHIGKLINFQIPILVLIKLPKLLIYECL